MSKKVLLYARLDEFDKRLSEMYSSVDIILSISEGLVYLDSLSKTSNVNTAIPNGRDSLDNTINISQSGTLNSLTVSITIDHEDHDEMYIKLTAPNGNPITLFYRERGHADGVQTFTYSSTFVSGLARLAGGEIAGDWLLNVRDAYTGRDTGTLRSWTLNLDASLTSTTSTDSKSTSGSETEDENALEQFFILFGIYPPTT